MLEESGIVLWFDEVKGYGFIKPNKGNEDLFVHFRDVIRNVEGEIALQKNQKVLFEVHTSEKGAVAKNVKSV